MAGTLEMPARIPPMLASTGPLPADERAWGFEVKWDGIRAIAYLDGERLLLQGRRFADYTPRYPELQGLAAGGLRAVLDGELVAFDEHGRPSFERLQARMHLASDAAVRARLQQVPVTYMVFDLLWLDGRETMQLPYERRRALLEELRLDGPSWRCPGHRRGEGAALLAATRELGVEGVVTKRLDCPYEPGRRSSTWVKVKNLRTQDVVIGGFTPGEGSRGGRLGALAVGCAGDDGLVYCGKVGTGFTERTLATLVEQLEPLRRTSSPFAGRQPPKGTVFVEPRLVARVEFREWTASGTLRAPSFKGLRLDVDAHDVTREAQPSAH
jgi:bifunctional non-homologous end joining protein LigD